MPCPTGVNIPQNFAILNNISPGSSRVQRWQIKRSYWKLVGTKNKLDRKNPNGNASI
jgi:predicted aldo/keto reductase-like oxidoreductase